MPPPPTCTHAHLFHTCSLPSPPHTCPTHTPSHPAQGSPICDVLGVPQRRWLQRELSSSRAALRIIASGSVPFGSLGYRGDQGICSGDDWQVGVGEQREVC